MRHPAQESKINPSRKSTAVKLLLLLLLLRAVGDGRAVASSGLILVYRTLHQHRRQQLFRKNTQASLYRSFITATHRLEVAAASDRDYFENHPHERYNKNDNKKNRPQATR